LKGLLTLSKSVNIRRADPLELPSRWKWIGRDCPISIRGREGKGIFSLRGQPVAKDQPLTSC